MKLARRTVLSLAEAREILERLIGSLADWAPLDAFLIDYLGGEERRATVIASSFASSLELVREGALELHQDRPLGPLFLRRRRDGAGPPPEAS